MMKGILPALVWGGVIYGLVTALPVQSWGYRHHDAHVRYHPYSQATFDLAQREDKPVFMVLSAVWCYWCKTYDERTLETVEVSQFLNRNFINIFVDLDQRQDLRHLFVNRGIPTTVIFTPEGKEFLSFSGLLEPDAFLSGISEILADIRSGKGNPYGKNFATIKNVRPYLVEYQASEGKDKEGPSGSALAALARERESQFLALISDNFDPEQGGIGSDKKYPLGALLQYLLESGHESGNVSPHVVRSLNLIARHLYDSVEGGFFRYTDRRNWTQTRHEKMLTTNINMIRTYQLAAKAVPAASQPAGNLKYRKIFEKSLRFFLDTYYRKGGGFYGSLDGKNPGYYRKSAERRKKMRPPHVDKTIYTAWNSEAVSILSDIYLEDPSPELRNAIESTLNFLAETLFSPSKGFQGYYLPDRKQVTGTGQLTDNSWAVLAFIGGYQLTGNASYKKVFEDALSFIQTQLYVQQVRAFRLWSVPSHPGLREEERISEEVPMGPNGVMAFALLRGYQATGKSEYLNLARNVIASILQVDPEEFDENPNDRGKVYLESFVYLHRAQHQLARIGS